MIKFPTLPAVRISLILPSIFLLMLGLTELFWMNEALFLVQIIAAILGVFIFLAISTINPRYWIEFSTYVYIISILLLIIPLFLPESRGSHRWIELGPVSIQTSEITRPLLIISFAAFAQKIDGFSLKIIAIYLAIVLIPFFLLISQPDLGSGLLLAVGWLGILVTRQIPLKYWLVGVIILSLLAPVGWNLLHDYQQNRIIAFINPQSDPLGIGYNVIQSKLAIGSGQIWGKGLGRGTQSQLRFLPEHHTDFMFASIAEELGFIGSLTIILLYGILFSSILKQAVNAPDSFSYLANVGLFSSLFAQVIINIGMNQGLMPVTGITLPLLSYGGSSLVSTALMLGLVNSFHSHRRFISSIRIH